MPWQEITDPEEMAAAEAMLSGGSGAGGGAQSGAVAPIRSRKDRLQLQAAGLPVLAPERDPLSRVTDPKQRAMTQRTLMTMGQKRIDKNSEDVKAAQDRLAQLSEFDALNSQGVTGGFGGWLQSKLPSFMQNDEAQRVEQLATGMARGNRIPGEGTISDFDARMFQRMTGGLDKSQAANESYIKASQAVQKAALDRQAFNEAFLAANGTMTGADTLWRQYANANPMFDAKSGGYVGNRPAWNDYFAERARVALAGGNPDAPRRRAGMMPPAASRSTPAPAPARAAKPAAGPARISGDAEYNRLPKGARYIGPDGIERVK